MKNAVTSSAAQNLLATRWNGFQVANISAAAYANIAAPTFTINKLTTVASIGGSQPTEYRLTITGGGVVPAWCQVGSAVIVAGTLPGAVDAIAGRYTVKVVADNGTYFEVMSNGAVSSAQTNVTITNGLVTLILECQKVMFRGLDANTDTIAISPGVDVAGTALWTEVIGAAQSYEVSAPSPNPLSNKFDLGDWWVKSTSGAQTLQIRFI